MEGPAYLPVGTEVSAKYRGAFCEAKVKKIVRAIKIKVNLKETGLPLVVTDEDIKGPLKVGCSVEVKHPESGNYVEATINKITDQSMYTVVFDDGDENTLRRTQLCLKGEKHFVKMDTLDELPLTNPEHFGTPVLKGSKKKRRSASMLNILSGSDSDDSDEPQRRRYWGKLQDMIGKVYCMQQEDRKKSLIVPVLVVQPNADETELKTRENLLVKSFKDSKFYAVHRKELKEFTRETAMKNDDKALKSVYEKALLYFDARELPQHWDREEILGTDSDEEDEDEQSSDDEPSEEKDMFVAQLYKFMDDRGTPINKGPVIGTRDLNLHRLFRVVHKLGGYNRVTNQMKWRFVYSRMGLPNSATAANQIKTAYKKYLHAFEDFYRKLGSSMGTITRPSRNRHSSGRNIPGFRDRGDRGESSPRSPRSSVVKKISRDEHLDETVEEVKPQETRSSKAAREETMKEEPSDTDSPSKRKTRTTLEDKGKIVKEVKKSPKDETEASEKDDAKSKKRPVRKKLEKPLPVPPKLDDSEEVKKSSHKDEDELDYESEDVDDEDDDDAKSNKTTTSEDSNSKKYEFAEYPPGSRLKVKYGKGKNIKLYEAKVLDCESDGGSMHYLVHYNGWNVRYDEWVKKDRIMQCVFKSDGKRALTSTRPTLPGTRMQGLKKKIPPLSKAKPSQAKEEKEDKTLKTLGSKTNSKDLKPPRPTRSTSLETKLSSGLSPRKRSRRNSGHTETSDSKSRLSDDGSESDSGDEEVEEEEEHDGHNLQNESPPHLSDSSAPFTEKDGDKSHGPDTRESAFDIIKELQADMEFDKASQDSLERDLNIKVPELSKMNRNESDEEMDIDDILSCLKTDEYKFPSSENESVKSDGPEKRVIRGKTKTKGELKAKPDLSKYTKIDPAKAKTDITKTKQDATKSKSEPGKSKIENTKPKVEPSKSKVELPRAKVELAKLKSDIVKPKVESTKPKMDSTKGKTENQLHKGKLESNKQKNEIVKSKVDTSKSKVEAMKPKLQESVKTKAELKADLSAEKVQVDEEELPSVSCSDPPKEIDSEKAKVEKVLSSGDEQTIVSEKPTRGRPRKEKDSDIDKEEKSVLETPTKTRGRGRGKRKIEKEEAVDSEEEPLKKKSKKKLKKVKEDDDDKSVPPKLSSPSGDDMADTSKEESGHHSSQESIGWSNAPELTATPKLNMEDIVKDSDIPDEPAPPLSPVHMDGVGNTSQSELSSYDLRGAMETGFQEQANEQDKTVAHPVEDTPPQTPENVSADQTPHHEFTYEACSTKSEMEANLEVEKFLQGARPPGENSPSVYDPSNVSTASDESLNHEKVLDTEMASSNTAVKRKPQSEEQAPVAKKKRSTKKGSHKAKQDPKRGFSDFEDEDSKDALPHCSKLFQASSSGSYPALSKPPEIPSGVPKYDFIQQIEEAKFLEREQRVNFLFSKISDLRSVYMQLKAEVASIDRKRKRFRKKQRLAQEAAAQCLIGLEQSVL